MIKPLKDRWTIVIVGKWNVAIFGPKWVSENVFENKEISLEFPVQPGLPIRITSEDILIIPNTDRLVINPTGLNDELVKLAGEKACRILEKLPHTPISMTGINFAYSIEPIPPEIVSCFRNEKEDAILNAGYKTMAKSLGWHLEKENQILNLKCELNNELIISFNFHSITKNSEEAIAAINNKILIHKKTVEELLTEIYGLSLEE
ncbi:MAG: hypothetical protein AB1746_12140 [Candidatus Zixiibacteriota bacterium]